MRIHGQVVDPERLRVREQSFAEIGEEQKLIEPHGREIGGPENDVGSIDHELAVEPCARDSVGIGSVRFHVEGVELEVGLHTMPGVIIEKDVFAVIHPAVVASAERALG